MYQSQLRLVAVRSESGALILDDTYNASPESMLASLNLLSEVESAIGSRPLPELRREMQAARRRIKVSETSQGDSA